MKAAFPAYRVPILKWLQFSTAQHAGKRGEEYGAAARLQGPTVQKRATDGGGSSVSENEVRGHPLFSVLTCRAGEGSPTALPEARPRCGSFLLDD